jgi:hypothetical protein
MRATIQQANETSTNFSQYISYSLLRRDYPPGWGGLYAHTAPEPRTRTHDNLNYQLRTKQTHATSVSTSVVNVRITAVVEPQSWAFSQPSKYSPENKQLHFQASINNHCTCHSVTQSVTQKVHHCIDIIVLPSLLLQPSLGRSCQGASDRGPCRRPSHPTPAQSIP